jgi:nicotinamidase-related amidase
MKPEPNPNTPPPSRRLRRAHALLLVIDIQEKLLPAMWENERVIQQASRLIRGAAALEVPILVTEQYRRGLGPTVPELAALVPSFAPIEKLSFSGCTPEIQSCLQTRDIRDVVLCGIESHVCITQTALDLLDAGWRVWAVGEACSSRRSSDWQAGLQRMAQAGAVTVCTEMVLFEWLEKSGTPEFKKILEVVK